MKATRTLTDHEMLALTSALSLARDAYLKMATDAVAMGQPRVAEQFERQMLDAGRLYAELADYPEITVRQIEADAA